MYILSQLTLALTIIKLGHFLDLEHYTKSLTLPITQKPFKIFKYNLVHMFIGTKRMSIPSHIPLALKIIQLYPLTTAFLMTSKQQKSVSVARRRALD